jgi:Zn-finger nucleic acid-binding protein
MTMPAPPRQKDWDDDDYKRGYPHKKKKSLLGELFDF